nr:hypothetical protein BaRGS_035260 [Batillaria attramentaria]KAG5700905.1 hypothetical protein BaRGS_012312 [Batillaria attramentaria]
MGSLNTSLGVIRDEALADLGEAELIRTLKSQAASCRNDPTCAKCGGKDHDGKDCSSSPYCVNCKARTQKGDKGVEVTNQFSVLEDMEVVTIEDRPLPPSPLVSPSKTPAVT